MPNIALSTDELTLTAAAIQAQITSAQRAQKTGKSPHIIEVYKAHETVLKELETKFLKAAQQKGGA